MFQLIYLQSQVHIYKWWLNPSLPRLSSFNVEIQLLCSHFSDSSATPEDRRKKIKNLIHSAGTYWNLRYMMLKPGNRSCRKSFISNLNLLGLTTTRNCLFCPIIASPFTLRFYLSGALSKMLHKGSAVKRGRQKSDLVTTYA